VSLHKQNLPQIPVRCSKAFLLLCQPFFIYTKQISWFTTLSQMLLPFTNHTDHTASVCETKEVTCETGESQERVWALRELCLERSKIQHSNVPFYPTSSLYSPVRIVPCISNGVLIPHLLPSWGMNINLVAGKRRLQYRHLKHWEMPRILEKYSSLLCGQQFHSTGPGLYLFWGGELSLPKYETTERA